MPELFRTAEDYESYVSKLVGAGIISDASYIWWAMRPSAAHPTLELRAPDCCTRLADTIAIAALYRSLARRLFLNPTVNADLTPVSRALIVENKWRAQRYGIHGTYVDESRPQGVSFARWLDQVIDEVAGDAAALGCLNEVMTCKAIVVTGTSADAQLKVYQQACDTRADVKRSLAGVSQWLAQTTLGHDDSHVRPRIPDAEPLVSCAIADRQPERNERYRSMLAL